MRFILYFFLVIFILLALTWVFQRRLIYLPDQRLAEPKDFWVEDMRVVKLHTKDGLILNAWYKKAQALKPTLVFFHGNGGHLGYRGPLIRPFLDKGLGVLLVSYRGYGGNPGKPTEDGLYSDAEAAMAFLFKQSVACIILYGESLGTGVAIHTANRYPIKALILQSPYNSLTDVAKYHYPLLAPNWLLVDRFESDTKIKHIKMPVLFMHGRRDLIIPLALALRLYRLTPTPKSIKIFEHQGHNDLPVDGIVKTVMAFIERLNICKPAGGKKNEDISH